MLEDFYKDRLINRGIDVLIPSDDDIEVVNNVIYDELCLGVIENESRREFQRIIKDTQTRGADGVILGCTEVGLLIKPEDSPLPVFDTTVIHARSAAELSLEN